MKFLKNNLIYTLSLFIFVIAGVFAIGLGANQVAFQFFKDKLQVFLLADILRAILILFFVLLLNKYFYKVESKSLFQATRPLKIFFLGVLGGTAMVIFGFVVLYFSKSIDWIMPDSFREFYFAIFVTVITSLTTAFWEELIMRGFFLKGLLLRYDNKLAIVLSASFFGIAHLLGSNPSLLVVMSTMVAGVLLGLAFVRTKSLYLSMGLHFSWNCIQYLIFSKKIFSVKYINTLFAGSLTFEEGLVAIGITALAIIIIYYLTLPQQEASGLSQRIE